jgi:hypothetical protein
VRCRLRLSGEVSGLVSARGCGCEWREKKGGDERREKRLVRSRESRMGVRQ